jgi:hypothetical protein
MITYISLEELQILRERFAILRDRIIKHRQMCHEWQNGKHCFNCHNNTLTTLERLLK